MGVQKPGNDFLRNIGTLVLGSGFAQLLAILALPILSRLYEPEDFGLLGVYLAFIGILGTLSLLRYDLAIPLPGKDEEAIQVLGLCLLVLILYTGVVGTVFWFFGETLSALVKNAALLSIVGLIPLGVLGWGGFQLLAAWASRCGHFRELSRCLGGQGFVQAGTQTTLGLGSVTSLGLPLGNFIGQLVALTGMTWITLRKGRSLLSKLRLSRIYSAATRYWRFPVISLWSGVAVVLNQYLPILLLISLFGKAFAGLYLIGHRIFQLPLGLIVRAVGMVFLPEYSRKRSDRERTEVVSGLFGLLALHGLPVVLLFGLTAPITLPMVLGNTWSKAGWIAAWLCPWMSLALVYSPLSAIPLVQEKQGRELSSQCLLLVARVCPFATVLVGWDSSMVVKAFGISTFLSGLAYMVWLIRLGGVSSRSIIRVLMSAGRRSLLLLALPLGTMIFQKNEWMVCGAIALSFLGWLHFSGRVLTEALANKGGPDG